MWLASRRPRSSCTQTRFKLAHVDTSNFASEKNHRRARPSQAPHRKPKMILTTCAACAAPLAHNAPRCVRCKLRYCNATCQHDHWRRGHKQICKKIHRGGNAEQFHADKKYKEAVAVAVGACADDTERPTTTRRRYNV